MAVNIESVPNLKVQVPPPPHTQKKEKRERKKRVSAPPPLHLESTRGNELDKMASSRSFTTTGGEDLQLAPCILPDKGGLKKV